MVLVALVTLTSQVSPTDAYSISYLDCSSPSGVRTFQKQSICDGGPAKLVHGDPRLSEKSLQASSSVLQRQAVRVYSGHSCTVKVSTFFYKCGTWSHLKVAKTPELDVHLSLTTEKCRETWQTNRYADPALYNGIAVHPDQPVLTSTVALGDLREEDDSVVCSGETYHDGVTTHTNVVILKYYEIRVDTRRFLVSNGKVEVQEDHIRLPCHSQDGGCLVGHHTYVWTVQEEHCPLSYIKHLTAPAWTMDTFIVDHQEKLLINTTGSSTTYPGCTITVIPTEYPDIFISTSAAAVGLKPVSARDVQTSVHSAIRLSYLSYSLESKIARQSDAMTTRICQHDRLAVEDQLIKTENGEFGRVRGDVVYLFTCVNRTSTILEAQKCFTDIPISEGYVDPETRVFKTHSSQIPCHKRFPMVVKSNEGWIEILPELKPITAPRVYQHRTTELQSEDYKNSGLYTTNELEEFQHLLTFPDYRKALLTEVTLGNCVANKQCSSISTNSGITPYNFNQLIPKLAEQFDFLSSLDAFIRQNGDYLAFSVIVLVAFKLTVNVIILIITWMRAGPSGALAFITHLCCTQRVTADKIVRRRMRIRREEDDHAPGQDIGQNDYCLPKVTC